MSKKTKILLSLCLIFIVGLFGTKFYLDKNYLKDYDRTQIIGEDRYKTIVDISNKGWKKSKEAVLINTKSITDGVSATPFAYEKNIPMFFIESDDLNKTIKNQLRKLGVEKVYLIGGKESISKKIEIQLTRAKIGMERIAGKNGFETSLLLAKKTYELSGSKDLAVVNIQKGMADGVSLASAAAKNHIPIVMMKKSNKMEMIQFAKDQKIENTYIIGNETQLTPSFEKAMPNPLRIAGTNRFDTNLEIIKQFYDLNKTDEVYYTKGGIYTYADFVDNLSLGVVAAKQNKPILLSELDAVNESQFKFLKENNIKKINEVGFKLTRPKIITKNTIRIIITIVIIVLALVTLKRVVYL